MTVRKVVTRRSWHFRGFLPSLKNGRPIPFESILESNFLRLLEISPQVQTYQVQPTREHFMVGDKATTYVTDVAVQLRDGRELWCEVKPSVHLAIGATKVRMASATQHFASTSRRLLTFSEDVLSAEPRRTNLLTMMYHRRGPIPEEPAATKLLISKAQPQTISDLCDVLGDALAWRTLGLGQVGVDLEQIWSPASEIYLEGGHRHADIFA
ncbi:transposase [Pseudomonas silvicola]|nr:transposase [Pseudomonas silvicola]